MAAHVPVTFGRRYLSRAAPSRDQDVGMLTTDELERYARHIVLREVGGPGQQALKRARVLVVGAGGLGAPVLLYLAAAGVGTIGLIDDDKVSLSNLQRQVIHRTEDVGQPKVESAARALNHLNPHVAVETHPLRLTADNALARVRRLLPGPAAAGDGGGGQLRWHAHHDPGA